MVARTAPVNPLVQPIPADTLRRCTAVLRVLEGIRPDEAGPDPEGLGLAAILQTVADAVEYEAGRMAPAAA